MSSSQHKLSAALLAGLAAVAAGLGGCAGNGDGLNSNGQPIGSSSGGSGGTGQYRAVHRRLRVDPGERVHADLLAVS